MTDQATITATKHEVANYHAAVDLAFDAGWSDGLPIVPPTEPLIRACLDAIQLDPTDVVIEIPERGRTITAEKLAINAVMAGCRPEYLPVLVAILEAMIDPRYHFNHIASMGSAWPLTIVNGPVAERLGINSGLYLFGPGHRANLTIARGLSLTLRNCAGAKVEDTQRGGWGNPIRMVGCIAENEDLGWTPLHVQRGFAQEDSVVTVVSVYPGSPVHINVNERGNSPEIMLDSVSHAIANYGGAIFNRGPYTLLIGPHYVELFTKQGWSKDDVRNYIFDHAKTSVELLKQRHVWAKHWTHVTPDELEVKPGDDKRFVYLFKKDPEYDKYVSWPIALQDNYDRDLDLYVVGCGGNGGSRVGLMVPNYVSTNAVSRKIRVP